MENESMQRPQPVTEDMHTTPFHRRDWHETILAYHAYDGEWDKVFWEDEIAEGRSREYSHWMPLPSAPTNETNE
jgi:hypothetical protein